MEAPRALTNDRWVIWKWAAGIGLVIWLLVNALPTPWEYMITSPSDSNLELALSDLGGAGWEIVSARRAVTGGQGTYELIMKRRSWSAAFAPRKLSQPASGASRVPATGGASRAASYPNPNSEAAKKMLRSCIDGRVHALEGKHWVLFQMAGSTLPCTTEE
jgi:hypothetical protein